jgi:predicted 2-oxoglutarate/Fe(II)-dependent dioxygenase YbiX
MSEPLVIWAFDDIFTPEQCDNIVSAYAYSNNEKDTAAIGYGVGYVDKNIRNVERVSLQTYKDLGGTLSSAGLCANYQSFKFDVTHADQAEFLIYPAGGRYLPHVDTFILHGQPCRKLTVLAFLNDDFKGGKFYLQFGHEKFYPKQTKGSVIVFPSFFLHGVEDVEEGTRYSAVCWMVGNSFR